ncbi:MAG: hypothetical protein ACOVQA_08455 [Thermoflexibacteraceae bacterium]
MAAFIRASNELPLANSRFCRLSRAVLAAASPDFVGATVIFIKIQLFYLIF